MQKEAFIQYLMDHYQVELTEKQKEQFDKYYEILVEWNQKMNLTAITEKNEVYLKHFLDSLSLISATNWEEVTTVCDVGAGAGFPSLPLKIVFPHLKITIVDSLNKRIQFLNHLCQELGLDGVCCYHDRAETFGQNPEFREQFDIVTARAVARLNVLAELCVPLVKKDGLFIALKASKGREELAEAKKALEALGITSVEVETFALPICDDPRQLFIMKKGKVTPKKYPRKPGLPNKKPL